MNARTIINGFEVVSADDIDNTLTIAHEQLLAVEALFRAIALISNNRDIETLCNHGARQLADVANETDELRERAVKAGLVGGAA